VKPKVVPYRDEADLLSLMFAAEVIESEEIHIVLNPMLAVTDPDWIWETVGTFDLDPSTGIVGGCILDPDGRISPSDTCPVSMAFSPRPLMARTSDTPPMAQWASSVAM